MEGEGVEVGEEGGLGWEGGVMGAGCSWWLVLCSAHARTLKEGEEIIRGSVCKNLSLVPRPLPDFISQLWRKIGRRPGIKTTSRTGNGGLG